MLRVLAMTITQENSATVSQILVFWYYFTILGIDKFMRTDKVYIRGLEGNNYFQWIK